MTLVLFEKAGNVSHDSKLWFNVITTSLNLALGLNFLEAFKDMAKVLRWRVLANRPFSVREADLILSGESLMKLGTLMLESFKKPVTFLVCASWIALNIIAQGSIAILSLNYSMDSGINSTGIYAGHGNVSAARLDCYYQYNRETCDVSPATHMTTAHVYGELLLGRESCPYNDDSDIQNANQTCLYFRHNNGQEFAYRYAVYNPLDAAQAYPYLTDRIVRVSTGKCYSYDVDWANSPVVSGTDGKHDTRVFAFTNDTYTGHLPIPRSDGAFDATTYVYNGSALPKDEVDTACGDRCLRIYALRQGIKNVPPAHIFSCPITVSEVHNATEDWQILPKAPARMGAASIAMTGRSTNPTGKRTVWQQYQLYPQGSYWEAQNRDAQQVGALMAEFAVSSLAAMASQNPKRQVRGILPILGYHLDANWPYVLALAACIGGVHCLLVAIMLWIARPVVIIDDSNLCTARLLQGLVGRLEGRGSLLSGKRLAEEIQRAGPKNWQVVYGISQWGDVGGQRALTLGENREEVQVRKRVNGGTFPKGSYA